MRLRITHDTRYRYEPPVLTAVHMTHLTPPPTRCQDRLDARLQVHPQPASITESLDIYRNVRTFFEIASPHDELLVRASSLVETHAPDPVGSTLAWDAVRDSFVYHVGAEWHPAAEFIYPSHYVHPGEVFADYARPSFPPGRPLIDAARELMQRVHQDFTYASRSTEINTPAAEALAQRRGVCQDFSHVMLACLRSLGLPARYVSGYLLTQPPPGQPRLVGSDASHAWVAVFLPDVAAQHGGHGWYDLDPTNDRHGWGAPGEDFVRLAVGRDYADISPMRGVIHGGAGHELDVGVTVEPCDAASLAEAPPLPTDPFR
ncbi:MAG: transglutaminase family protein [Ottowia sp.]|nr:transglutaminase family protein [Ottowia sp.]MBP7535679.1 transglutaminase family protein [Ottowia sp.]